MAFTKIPAATNRTVAFTSSGTWTVPSGVYSAEFLVVGAGGAGGGTDNSVNTRQALGGGGGGGSVKIQTLPVTPGTSYTITIGAKGTGSVGAAGGNGGFSEVVLSGTTLIKCFGGKGGDGLSSANTVVTSAVTQTQAGIGGLAKTDAAAANTSAGGGGGGSIVINNLSSYDRTDGATEGSAGGSAFASTSKGVNGYMGFGSGGGGACRNATGITDQGAAPFGAGVGATTTSATAVEIAGTAAAANNGCGGGGAISLLSITGSAGGNGSDGLVRITYFA